MKNLTLNQAIKTLMNNDKNGTWYDIQTTSELKESLIEALTGYDQTETTYVFYHSILKRLEEV